MLELCPHLSPHVRLPVTTVTIHPFGIEFCSVLDRSGKILTGSGESEPGGARLQTETTMESRRLKGVLL
jgi:hypothetical protein